jgi:hypothetical protein
VSGLMVFGKPDPRGMPWRRWTPTGRKWKLWLVAQFAGVRRSARLAVVPQVSRLVVCRQSNRWNLSRRRCARPGRQWRLRAHDGFRSARMAVVPQVSRPVVFRQSDRRPLPWRRSAQPSWQWKLWSEPGVNEGISSHPRCTRRTNLFGLLGELPGRTSASLYRRQPIKLTVAGKD